MADFKMVGRAQDIEYDLDNEIFDAQPTKQWNPDTVLFKIAYEKWFVQWDGDLDPLNILLAIDLLIEVVEGLSRARMPLSPADKKSLVIAVILFAIDQLAEDDKDKPYLMHVAKRTLSRTIDQEVAKILYHAGETVVKGVTSCFCFPCFRSDAVDEEKQPLVYRVPPEKIVAEINKLPSKPVANPVHFDISFYVDNDVKVENKNDVKNENENVNNNENEQNVVVNN